MSMCSECYPQLKILHFFYSKQETVDNVGSMTLRIQEPYASPYGGSKAALEMISHTMRQEMEPLALHVIQVCSVLTLFLHIANCNAVQA
jgi:short-subunit dehydrogenase